MAVYKQFNTNEVVITPFYANKGFQFTGPQATASDVGIEYYQSIQGPYTTGSNPTGFTTRLDGVLVFSNIKQLYYSNYLTSSTGDNFPTRSLIPGLTPEYNDYVGVTTGPRFDNFLQSSMQQDRQFSQFSEDNGNPGPSVISTPSNLFGEKISPSTFNFTYTSSVEVAGGGRIQSFVHDDGEGNLIATQSLSKAGLPAPLLYSSGSVGQIFYSQGMAILTGGSIGNLPNFATKVGSRDGVGNRNLDSASISFSSSILITENQYKCTVRDSEYSYTLNPSILRPTGELTTVTNQLSSSIVPEGSPTNDWNPGVYLLPVRATLPDGIGVKGTANVTVASDSTISDITVNNPGRGYVAYDNVYIITTAEMGGTVSLIYITLSPKDIVFPSNPINKDQVYRDFATGSDFSPYVTTIGLYNNEYQLVAVGKLAQPIPISLYTDTTFIVNIDT